MGRKKGGRCGILILFIMLSIGYQKMEMKDSGNIEGNTRSETVTTEVADAK